MKPPTQQQISRIINALDWTGHIEIGDMDKFWLAGEIAAAFTENKRVCGACGVLQPIVVQTRLGPICEDCLDEATDEATEMRETMEQH